MWVITNVMKYCAKFCNHDPLTRVSERYLPSRAQAWTKRPQSITASLQAPSRRHHAPCLGMIGISTLWGHLQVISLPIVRNGRVSLVVTQRFLPHRVQRYSWPAYQLCHGRRIEVWKGIEVCISANKSHHYWLTYRHKKVKTNWCCLPS